MKRKKICFSMVGFILVGVLSVSSFFVENKVIKTTEIVISDDRIPESFNNSKIVHISDLHSDVFGRGNERLLSKIKGCEPDMIFITGDLVDERKIDVNVTADFVRQAVSIAPVYYVSGNHESFLDNYSELRGKIENAGATVLENKCIEIEKGKDKICIAGFSDPYFDEDASEYPSAVFQKHLEGMKIDTNSYTLLLSHRPEALYFYAENGFDLVFSGHAHGGQVRLPFFGGIIAPHQGFFPEFTSGLYEKNGTKMIVSRGLGNSTFPFRFNNNPEIIAVTLSTRAD